MTLHEWIQQIETEIAASKVHNHLFRTEIASGTVNGIRIEMIEKGIQKLEWLKELQRYKDLEEAGRLIELPCKVGDTVYGRMHNYKVIGFTDNELLLSYGIEGELYPTRMPFAHIGKTVFLTKAEAEAKLEELKGEQDVDV